MQFLKPLFWLIIVSNSWPLTELCIGWKSMFQTILHAGRFDSNSFQFFKSFFGKKTPESALGAKIHKDNLNFRDTFNFWNDAPTYNLEASLRPFWCHRNILHRILRYQWDLKSTRESPWNWFSKQIFFIFRHIFLFL